jgi:predicted solute-binding protein
MYVNNLTVDMGEVGKRSIEKIFLMANANGILKANTATKKVNIIFAD